MVRIGNALPGAWTADRIRLHELLESQQSDIAEMYSTAIDSLLWDPLTTVNMMVGAHCIRELASSIPRILVAGHNESRADMSGPTRALADAWTKHGLLEVAKISEMPVAISVPVEVYQRANDVAVAEIQGSTNSFALTSAIATGSTNPIRNESTRLLHDTLAWFRKWMHAFNYTEKASKQPPSPDELKARLEIFESALLARFENITVLKSEIDEILQLANLYDETDAQ